MRFLSSYIKNLLTPKLAQVMTQTSGCFLHYIRSPIFIKIALSSFFKRLRFSLVATSFFSRLILLKLYLDTRIVLFFDVGVTPRSLIHIFSSGATKERCVFKKKIIII